MSKYNLNLYSFLGIFFFYFITFLNFDITVGVRLLDLVDKVDFSNINFSIKGLGSLTFIIPSFLNNYIFSYFNYLNFNFLTVIISTFVLFFYFSKSKNFFNFLLLLFLVIPPMFMSLNIFCKEFIFILFLYLFIKNYPKTNKFIIYLYLLFRPHYIFIVYFFSKKKKYFYFFSIVLIFFFYGPLYDFFINLIYRKNNYLYSDVIFSANTQILLLDYSYSDFLSLVKNIIYILFQTHMPILYFDGIKIIYLQLYILIVYFLIFSNFNIFSKILLFNLFFFSLIDVDLGQYLRHISSFFLFYIFIINEQIHE